MVRMRKCGERTVPITYQPAFEVTRVDSMQWNRSCVCFTPEEPGDPAAEAPLPADLVDRVRDAVKRQVALSVPTGTASLILSSAK